MRVEIFTSDVKRYLLEATGDDCVILQDFKDRVESRLSNLRMATVAKNWSGLNNANQLELSEIYAGELHMGRFMILMDYLSEKIAKENICLFI